MERILIIQLRQLGDIILTTPCVRELKRFYPNAQIDFLSHTMGKLVLLDNPDITNLFTYSESDSLKAQWKLIKSLRAQKYDLALDFMYNPRSALLCILSGAKKRMAFPSRRSFAYNQVVPQPKKSDYIVREKFSYLKCLGAEPQDESLVLPWFEKHLTPYISSKSTLFPDHAKIRVALSPTHRREARQWPVQYYAELADRLTRDWGARITWIWGPGEEEFVRSASSLCQEETVIAPKTSFRELAALLANCDLFVGNSNGPSHVAVSTGIPSFQLHGPTVAKAWCPMTSLHRGVQGDSMESIKINDVDKQLQQLLPVVEKRVEARMRFGDRISWNQDWGIIH